jgi:hypothetical protein
MGACRLIWNKHSGEIDDDQTQPASDSITHRPRPLRAEVYKKQLTGIEQAVILAMLEIGDHTGEVLRISIPRIAAYTKFDKRSVQRALWGDHRTHPDQPKPEREKGKPEPECPYCKGLVQRRILHQVAEANWGEHRPSRYRLILDILDDSGDVRKYLDQKQIAFPPRDPRSPGSPRPTVAPPATHGRTPRDPRSHDSRSIDSEPIDSRPASRTQIFTTLNQPICDRCGGAGRVHQPAHIPGPRLIVCPQCNPEGMS